MKNVRKIKKNVKNKIKNVKKRFFTSMASASRDIDLELTDWLQTRRTRSPRSSTNCHHPMISICFIFFLPVCGVVLQCATWWTCDSDDRGFESRPFEFQLTTLGKLYAVRMHEPL